METSDSECFESAGEEFYSDDEKDEYDKKPIKKETRKIDLEGKNAKNEKCVLDKDDNKNKNTEVKSLKIETSQNLGGIVKDGQPKIEKCVEKGVDDIIESKKIKNDDDLYQTGFTSPPEIVQCWEEDVNPILLNKVITKESNKTVSTLSETSKKKAQDDNMWDNDWDIEENLLESSDVDSTLSNLQSIPSAHPEKPKTPVKDLEKEYHPKKMIPNKAISSIEKQDSIKNIEKKLLKTKISAQIDEHQEENMWDNDQWSVEEKEDDTLKESIKNTKKELEENQWEDNWEDFEEPISKSSSKPSEKPQSQEKPEEFNSWEDDWESIENIPKSTTSSNISSNAQEENKKDTGWSSWGSWGLSSVISTATNLTSQVSQSITTVLETGIGAPNPEELAKSDREIEKEVEKVSDDESENHDQEEDKPIRFGLGSLVQGVTKLVETTGSKVITGGLDTLETIGKKTMEVLQENDPGLKKKRAFLALNDDKPILSQMLREAKEKSEREYLEMGKKEVVIKRPNYEILFDDHQGLVHLEALEMLSKQCDIKLSSLMDASYGEALIETQETLEQIKELCELPEDDEEEILNKDEIKEKIEASLKELNVPICYDKLISMWDDVESWLDDMDLEKEEGKEINSRDIHQKAIETLAELTAIAVEQFHKGGELLLVKQHRSTADEADSLVQLTVTLTALIGIVSSKFSEKLNRIIENEEDKTEVNELITNVFYEAANSTTYIKDAFQLLIPVLQVGAV